MKIPTGNFGQGATTGPVQHTRINTSGMDGGDVTNALGNVAGVLGGIVDQNRRIEAQKAEENDALERVKLGNGLMMHEIDAQKKADEIQQRVMNGKLSYDEAEKAYDEEISELKPPVLNSTNPVFAETLLGGVRRNEYKGRASVSTFVEGAKKVDYRNQIQSSLDLIGKKASMPGADIESLNNHVRALEPRLALAGMDKKVIQDAIDRNWTTEAQQRVIMAKEIVPALKQMEFDLTNEKGRYVDKLDAEKRTTIWRGVQNELTQITQRQETEISKREAKAEQLTAWRNDQMVTGIQLSADKEFEIMEAVKGTASEQDYRDSVMQSSEIMRLRTAPFDAQERYIAEMEATVRNSPSDNPKRDLARVENLRAAKDKMQTMAKESPLSMYQLNTGQVVEPIDMSVLNSESGVAIIESRLAGRYHTLNAMRKKYGPQVSLNPWLPQEAEALKQGLEMASQANNDKGKIMILGMLSRIVPDVQAYRDTLAPIAQSDRLTFLAGEQQFKNNKTANGVGIAELMFKGQRVLNDKTVQLPTEEEFRKAFDIGVGNALPIDSQDRADAYDRFKNIYAGLADKVPSRSTKEGKIDTDLSPKVITLATGGIAVHASRKTVMPFGMKEDDFKTAVNTQLAEVSALTGFPQSSLEDMPLVPLPGYEGLYFLSNQGAFQRDPKTGKPIVVRIK